MTFADPSRVVYLVSLASKSSRDSKIMGYNPRKRPEMAENTTFADPSRVVHLVSLASKSSRDSKIMGYNPRKRPEIAENTSFADLSIVVYQGSHGIEIRPGPENRGF